LVAPDTAPAHKAYKDIAACLITKAKDADKIITNKPKVSYDPKEGYIVIEIGDKIKKVTPMNLRKKCICAACVDEFSGAKILKDKQIPENIYPTRMEDKGNYAVAIVWSDGHRSSIYPYKRLLSNEIEVC
jgi:ATP-binding protein involved in chromosome partitioning